ncbi:MAG TPA: 50S ribosomal protein L11 methyltransferase [Bryobacteraceae bacterium]|nr:50S ribosomal protein L11 methyltransferase [Bryobacteraceae bacterium]
MFSLFLQCSPADNDNLSSELWELGTCGIQEEPGGLRAFFDDGEPLELVERFRDCEPIPRQEDSVDWEQVSRDAWPPLEIGERFFLVPPWRDDLTPAGRLRLEMTPGMACGTGHHPATQLCLEALERTVEHGDTVVDIGAGSGILSVAARLLGAGLVVACDIDGEAVSAAKERLGTTPLFAGSADALKEAIADVIVANISSAAVEALAQEFERIAKPHATLIISGFPEWDPPEYFQPASELKKAGWLCWICAY